MKKLKSKTAEFITEEGILLDMENSLKELFKKMDKPFIEMMGRKCDEYYYKCISCKLWNIYEQFKRELEMEYLK